MTGAWQDPGSLPLIIAHRGASELAPENTVPAFVGAARAGADMLEIDVQMTSDGAAVVIHDDTVDRTTDGAGRVADLASDELRHLDAGAWFDPAYAGTPLPRLADVLALLTRYRDLELLLEVKGTWPADPLRAMLGALTEAGLGERVLVQSFTPQTVATAREVAPHLRRGLLIGREEPGLLDLCAELDVVTCNPRGDVLLEQPDLLPTLHGHGLRSMVWTLNEPNHWAAALAAGADGIITDRPDRLRGWLEGQSSTAPLRDGAAAPA
ncbi:glycerophosphodiester phosphodiesterase [Georgenia deserti]|uniref:Glycerophosphodiester phosphodiesterase n=1 Tax=Georgenia deserti TaxID=2093781 RepID=A0ABW4L076_9MICO